MEATPATPEAAQVQAPALPTSSRVRNLDLVRSVEKFRSKDSTRPALGYLIVNAGNLFATDGHRLLTCPVLGVADTALADGFYVLVTEGKGRQCKGTLNRVTADHNAPNLENVISVFSKVAASGTFQGEWTAQGQSFSIALFKLAQRGICVNVQLLKDLPGGEWSVFTTQKAGEAQDLGAIGFSRGEDDENRVRALFMPLRYAGRP